MGGAETTADATPDDGPPPDPVVVGGRLVLPNPTEDDPTGLLDPRPVPGRAPFRCRDCGAAYPFVRGAYAGLCGYCKAAVLDVRRAAVRAVRL